MPIPVVDDMQEGGAIKKHFNESKGLKFKQFFALQMKHLLHTKRNPKGVICEVSVLSNIILLPAVNFFIVDMKLMLATILLYEFILDDVP